MLLLTVRESLSLRQPGQAAGEAMPTVEVRHRGYATELALGQAILQLRSYEAAFNARYAEVSKLAYELLQVGTIEPLSDEELDLARLVVVEDLDPDDLAPLPPGAA